MPIAAAGAAAPSGRCAIDGVSRTGAATGAVVAGRYRLSAPLLREPDHELWQAVDDVLGRPVAVRLVCGDPQQLAAMHDAAVSAGRVVHDAIAAVYDTGTVGDCFYLVREWVPGTALRDRLLGEQLPMRAVTDVALQIAAALAALAEAGVPHGRLHPGNVVLTPAGQVKLVDVATAATRHGAAQGDARALGGLLYAALTRRWPHRLLEAPVALPDAVYDDDGQLCSPQQLRAGVPTPLDTVATRALQQPSLAGPVTASQLRTLTEPLHALPRAALVQTTYDDSLPPEGDPREEPDLLSPRGRRTWWLVAAGTTAAVLVLLWAAASAIGPPGTPETPPRAGGTSATTPAPAPDQPLEIVGIADYDPLGDDGEENPHRLELIGAGGSEGWRTSRYQDQFGTGFKDGVGLLLDLGRPVALREVTVEFAEGGVGWELRTADAPDPAFDATRVVAEAAPGDATSAVQVPEGTEARYWVVWLTELPGSAGSYRAEIRSISVST